MGSGPPNPQLWRMLYKLCGVVAGWLFWLTVLFAIIVAGDHHLLDWSGIVRG